MKRGHTKQHTKTPRHILDRNNANMRRRDVADPSRVGARKEYLRTWRAAKIAADPDYFKKQRDKNTLRMYGMTTDERQALLDSQNGACKICGKPIEFRPSNHGGDDRAHVDHCHNTGAVRGILCHTCNTGLGLFDDSPDKLKQALRYLESA